LGTTPRDEADEGTHDGCEYADCGDGSLNLETGEDETVLVEEIRTDDPHRDERRLHRGVCQRLVDVRERVFRAADVTVTDVVTPDEVEIERQHRAGDSEDGERSRETRCDDHRHVRRATGEIEHARDECDSGRGPPRPECCSTQRCQNP
jgi:hypothetical protein